MLGRKHVLLSVALTIVAFLAVACASGETEPKTYTIGVLNHAEVLDPVFQGFRDAMTELGYGENSIVYEYSGPTGSVDALDPVLADLMTQNLDLLLTFGTPPTVKAHQAVAGSNLPVLFVPVNDPVGSGLVDSLESPGGNMTGIRNSLSTARALEWLLDIAPQTSKIFVPHNPDDSSSVASLGILQDTANKLGVSLEVREVRTTEEILAAAAEIPEDVDAVFLMRSGLITSQVDSFVTKANELAIPVATTVTDLVDSGVMISFGTGYYQMGKQAAHLADQILRGIAPSDLPIETADAFLSINLQVADALGINISDDTLGQAQYIVRGQE